MKKQLISLAGICMIAGAFGTSVSANSYYCDNDASSTYSCTNNFYGSWVRNTGAGNWNNDYRIISANGDSGYYDWKFTTDLNDQYPSVYVWLANSQFTNTNARYYIGYTNYSTLEIVGSINQNTASSGWNYVGGGKKVFLNNATLSINQKDYNGNANTSTGADYIRFDTSVNTLASQKITDSQVAVDETYHTNPEIQKIQEKMLNATDNFQNAKGSFDIVFSNIKQEQNVQFDVQLGNQPNSYVKINSKNGLVNETISDGKSILDLDHNKKQYEKSLLPIDKVTKIEGARHFKNKDKENVYLHRQDLISAHAASEVLLPQNYAFWLKNDNTKIVGYDKYLGRDATIISGTHDQYVADKLLSKTFTLWIDSKTGILLKLLDNDQNGKLVNSIVVKDIQLDKESDKKMMKLNIPSGWNEVSPKK
ncbi:hypothetical protein ACFVVQ_25305 [Paenibacillus chitinolyticus]|uniref:hypothetical protein n=1 Tax=Paenibacillus chitinolyticus TaxID=79263 RepID=UPI0036D77814